MSIDGQYDVSHTLGHRDKFSTSDQVREALFIASGNYLPADLVASYLIDPSMAEPVGFQTVRNFMHHNFYREFKTSYEYGFPTEGINSEAGVWKYEIAIEPELQENARKFVERGLQRAYDENTEGIKNLLIEVYPDGMDFEDRLSDQNRSLWIELLGMHRDKLGKGYHDWSIYQDDDGKTKVRDQDKMTINDLFQVEVVNKTELQEKRDFKQIIDDHLVGKVMLVTDETGNVANIELLFSHFSNDEEQGRRILNSIADHFKISNANLLGTNILRRRIVLEKGDFESKKEEVWGADIESSYRVSSQEEKLIKLALNSFNEPMNMSVFLIEAMLALETTGRSSGYICVSPDLPRKGEKSISAGLQFALLPKKYGMNYFRAVLSRLDSVEDLMAKAKKLNLNLENLNLFIKSEIDRSRRGMSTIGVLGTYVPDLAQRAFGVTFKKQKELVSNGSVQISSLSDFKKEKIQNILFTTALSVSTNIGISTVPLRDGRIINIRFRTDTKDFYEAKNRLEKSQGSGMTTHSDNILPKLTEIVEEKVKNFRKACILMAVSVAIHNYNRKYSGDELETKITEIKDLLQTIEI